VDHLPRSPGERRVERFGSTYGIGDAGTRPDHRRLLNAELRGDQFGTIEADAANVAREPIRVLGANANGVSAVGLENAHPRDVPTPFACKKIMISRIAF
jgi:hypothetical protein